MAEELRRDSAASKIQRNVRVIRSRSKESAMASEEADTAVVVADAAATQLVASILEASQPEPDAASIDVAPPFTVETEPPTMSALQMLLEQMPTEVSATAQQPSGIAAGAAGGTAASTQAQASPTPSPGPTLNPGQSSEPEPGRSSEPGLSPHPSPDPNQGPSAGSRPSQGPGSGRGASRSPSPSPGPATEGSARPSSPQRRTRSPSSTAVQAACRPVGPPILKPGWAGYGSRPIRRPQEPTAPPRQAARQRPGSAKRWLATASSASPPVAPQPPPAIASGEGGRPASAVARAPKPCSVDMSRLIWKMERKHTAEILRLQADMHACRQEIAALRQQVAKPQPPDIPPPAAPSMPSLSADAPSTKDTVELMAATTARQAQTITALLKLFGDDPPSGAVPSQAAEEQNADAPIADLLKDVEQLRSQVVAMQERSVEAEKILMPAPDMSKAPWHGGSATESVEGSAASDVHRIHSQLWNHLSTLSTQIGQIQESSSEAKHASEDGQCALRALLQTSRMIAEQLGVGPVLLGRPTTASTRCTSVLADEAEALAAGVAHMWRMQKTHATQGAPRRSQGENHSVGKQPAPVQAFGATVRANGSFRGEDRGSWLSHGGGW
eukprot:gnl/TRDRNA2_/TRDRNA2_166256_c3_seq4.p1 gnl/TRDRNA2_/TRDRNA2_166256_c3~~gnl/TRDRNA2_/TRDRNA2_166256_c3_seq4.p1  ORF type:complete len:613 (+),score=91.44 gnl/TRDRNA2_/TRDRNA2_166256_c3_seq4:47-1885(+)